MSELNIKKEIGTRILEARKAKGLTLKALGELAGGLKQTRLTNWEQGVRTPGPEEIKSLAQALDVSPAYLMCLSDEKQFEVKSPSQLIPLLDHCQACDAKKHINMHPKQQESENITISVSSTLLPDLSIDAFALKILDDSMMPEFRLNDILVIDPAVSPKPSKYVAVKIGNKMEAIICQYKKLSYTSPEFELHTLNDNWPNIKAEDGLEIEIIGTVMQNIRTC
ncbi:TPA: LexA family transcriptional regulator [Legionella pneumophila]|nr:LexA family transcriptional regulator [Legionella pneumophila]